MTYLLPGQNFRQDVARRAAMQDQVNRAAAVAAQSDTGGRALTPDEVRAQHQQAVYGYGDAAIAAMRARSEKDKADQAADPQNEYTFRDQAQADKFIQESEQLEKFIRGSGIPQEVADKYRQSLLAQHGDLAAAARQAIERTQQPSVRDMFDRRHYVDPAGNLHTVGPDGKFTMIHDAQKQRAEDAKFKFEVDSKAAELTMKENADKRAAAAAEKKAADDAKAEKKRLATDLLKNKADVAKANQEVAKANAAAKKAIIAEVKDAYRQALDEHKVLQDDYDAAQKEYKDALEKYNNDKFEYDRKSAKFKGGGGEDPGAPPPPPEKPTIKRPPPFDGAAVREQARAEAEANNPIDDTKHTLESMFGYSEEEYKKLHELNQPQPSPETPQTPPPPAAAGNPSPQMQQEQSVPQIGGLPEPVFRWGEETLNLQQEFERETDPQKKAALEAELRQRALAYKAYMAQNGGQ